MQPVGHIAGTAAAVTGCISTIRGTHQYLHYALLPNGSATFVGFSICAALAIVYLFI
jgi:DHA1 family bicyclomycin/chloramphenicol resistance-like MFS transporter